MESCRPVRAARLLSDLYFEKALLIFSATRITVPAAAIPNPISKSTDPTDSLFLGLRETTARAMTRATSTSTRGACLAGLAGGYAGTNANGWGGGTS